MTRDELILYFQPVVDNIVKKYNNHQSDEDLQSAGMIKCIKAIDRCLSEGVDDPDKIKPRVVVWVRNEILDTIYVNNNVSKIENIDDYSVGDNGELDVLMFEIRKSLKGKALKVFEMKYFGNTEEEICKELNIKKTQYYEYLKQIKNAIIGKN